MSRSAHGGLLVATAALYLTGLGGSGWGNAYYAGAAQAGSASWSAFLFGASDAAGSITIDKPPLAVWPMALSVRLFGLSSWSVLVPQALMGVATVALVVALVRRVSGSDRAGLLAGVVTATTPVAVLMFRFDNPDALLTLLLTGAAYAVVRALGPGNPVRWLVLGGVLVGLAVLTKSLQACLVLPGLALGYAVAATVPWRARLRHLLAAAGGVVLGGGWWFVLVGLVPASARPYVGGTSGDSVLELTLGYNGLERITGGDRERNAGWGDPGPLRLLRDVDGGHAGWLLPAAIVLGVVAVVWGVRMVRALAVVLLGWLVVTAAVFSLMAGVYHPYYAVVLAPPIGGLVALGAREAWHRRAAQAGAAVLVGAVAVTTTLASVLLARSPDWHPWLRVVVVVLGVLAAVPLAVRPGRRLPPRVAAAAGVVALAAGLLGPAASAVTTAATPHSGSVPTAGPVAAPVAVAGNPVRWAGGSGAPDGDGGVGVQRAGSRATARVTALLLDDADDYTWVGATIGGHTAAGWQLATGRPVMPLGGFDGLDPSPTLGRFQDLVADEEIHWYLARGGGRLRDPAGRPTAAGRIERWVARHFVAVTVDGIRLHDLTRPAAPRATVGTTTVTGG